MILPLTFGKWRDVLYVWGLLSTTFQHMNNNTSTTLSSEIDALGKTPRVPYTLAKPNDM